MPMDRILCFVDFTPTSEKAMDQSIAIAKWKQASITVCHIVARDADLRDDLIKDLSTYEVRAEEQGVTANSITGRGSLYKEAERIANDLKPELVVVGTHGKIGLKQNLFGSNIYRLVQRVNTACLVVSDYTTTIKDGFKNILMPVAPHTDYLVKVQQTVKLLADDGTIHIFEIRKPGAGFDEKLVKNVEEAKAFLAENRVSFDYIEKGSRDVSDGFSDETLLFAVENGMDLLSIMTRVSEVNKRFGKTDKETALLNKVSLPVLTCNA
jgi:nucleotide-binding universal stress UspA family protein